MPSCSLSSRRIQPPPQPGYDPNQVAGWFAHHHEGLLVGFALIFTLGGFSATSIALITYSIRRMSVSSRVRLFLPDRVLGQHSPGVSLRVCGADRRGHAARPQPSGPAVDLRLGIPVVLRHDGRLPRGLLDLDDCDPSRQEPGLPDVVRLSEPVQRPHRGRRCSGLDLPPRRFRVERCDRLVDQRGRVRRLHRCLHRAAPERDPPRRLRSGANARPAGDTRPPAAEVAS